jgi:hypothetical protein
LSKGFSQHLPASTGATFSRADQSTEKSQITQKSEPTTNKIASSTIPTPIVEPKRSLASSNSSNKLPTHLSQTAATSTESSSPEQLQKLRGDSEPKTIKLDGGVSKKAKKSIKMYFAGCFVTFQAEPRAKRPANHTAPFELSLDVESIEVCAIRCYQVSRFTPQFDATSLPPRTAAPGPSTMHTTRLVSSATRTNTSARTLRSSANSRIWPNCARSAPSGYIVSIAVSFCFAKMFLLIILAGFQGPK